jgi:tripartite-type tricarboxylate transporter receptor subunit TctC
MTVRYGLAMTLMLGAVPAWAQQYPDRPVRLVVPFVAGGATDIVSRALGARLSQALGQTFVVDNRGGAGGVIGTDIVAKAPPDGYTLLMASAANPANASLVKNLSHDFAKDLAPITLVVMSPYLLVVPTSVAANNVSELIALAKAKPGALNFASSGSGSSQHLTGILFNQMAGTNIVHVPYKGAGAALTDVVSGQIQVFFAAIPGALPYVKGNRLRALGVTSPKRSAGIPDIPTIAESGVPGFDMSGWYGLLAPRGTPPAIIKLLNAETVKALAAPQLRELLVTMGLDPIGNSPAEFGTFIAAEITKYRKLTQSAGMKPE